MNKVQALEAVAKRLRIHSLRMTTEAGSGHPTTCLSMAEIAACLFFAEMRYDVKDPRGWANDECVLSKGHAAPILWAAYAEAGIPKDVTFIIGTHAGEEGTVALHDSYTAHQPTARAFPDATVKAPPENSPIRTSP